MSTVCNDCKYFHNLEPDVLRRPKLRKWVCMSAHPIVPLQGACPDPSDRPIFTCKNGDICKEYRYGGPRPTRLEKVLDVDIL